MKMRALFAAILLALTPLPAFSVGTIFGLPLSQQVDAEGDPLSGALLYIYAANTSTPSTVYSNFALTVTTTNPVVADSAGRLPEFWLADGDYRVRLTTSGGIAIFDQLSVTSLGASSGAGGGGGVDTNAILATGDLKFRLSSGALAGFVRANGRTIGSAASGAAERANADTQVLYEFIWNNCADAICVVSSGRGANATADFGANKTIAVWDMRGRAGFGLDDMGNSAAGVISGGTTVAGSGGAETKTLSSGELASHTHTGPSHTHSFSDSGTTSSSGSHNHDYTRQVATGSSSDANVGATRDLQDDTTSTSSAGAHTHTFSFSGTTGSGGTGSTGSAGSGTAFSLMNPYRLGTWYVRL